MCWVRALIPSKRMIPRRLRNMRNCVHFISRTNQNARERRPSSHDAAPLALVGLGSASLSGSRDRPSEVARPARVAHIDHRVHMAAASAALELDAKGQALLREAQHVVARDGTPCPGLQQAAVDALINVVGNRQFAQMVADATGESLTLRARARLGRCVEAARALLLTAGSPSLLSHHRSQALSSSSRAQTPGWSSSPHPTRRWPVRCHPP